MLGCLSLILNSSLLLFLRDLSAVFPHTPCGDVLSQTLQNTIDDSFLSHMRNTKLNHNNRSFSVVLN